MEVLKDRLTRSMMDYFGQDERLIQHALRVTRYAEDSLRHEEGADGDVVIAAAILHDIGIPEASIAAIDDPNWAAPVSRGSRSGSVPSITTTFFTVPTRFMKRI